MRSLTVAALLLVTAPCLAAQAADGAARTTPVEKRTAITINPFAAVAGYLTGDFERAVSPAVTLGVGGGFAFGNDFDDYRALDAKVRYYPNERVLRGFAVGGSLGVVSATGYDCCSAGSINSELVRFTRPTFGTELSYQWLLGPHDRFVTVLGFGVKRLFGSEANIDQVNGQFIPTARVNIGFAFP